MKHSMSRLQTPFDVTSFIGELCNRETDAVSVTCKKQSLSYCPVDYVPFQNQCFGFKTEIPLDFRAAQNDCKKNGGNLIEIDNQKKNDFISHYLLTNYPLNNFWTGGISTSLDNIQIGLWQSSQNPIGFNKFYGSVSDVKSGVTLQLYKGYYWWSTKDFKASLPYICEIPFYDIGCLTEDDPTGTTYNGVASRTELGMELIHIL